MEQTRQEQLEALCDWLADQPCLRANKGIIERMGKCKPEEFDPMRFPGCCSRNTCQTCWARHIQKLYDRESVAEKASKG